MEARGLHSGSEDCRGPLSRGVAGHLEIHPEVDQRRSVREERADWQEDLPYDKSLTKGDSVGNAMGKILQEILRKNDVWV